MCDICQLTEKGDAGRTLINYYELHGAWDQSDPTPIDAEL